MECTSFYNAPHSHLSPLLRTICYRFKATTNLYLPPFGGVPQVDQDEEQTVQQKAVVSRLKYRDLPWPHFALWVDGYMNLTRL